MTTRRDPKVVSVSVTAAGRALARRLPYESLHGSAADTVRRLWSEVDAFVLFLATGAATRIIAPLLSDKAKDPAVICVNEAGRFAVALCGGHAGGANSLARDVAERLGATAVLTTASDAAGITSLDSIGGFAASGDVAGVMSRWLDGSPPAVNNQLGWPLPPALSALPRQAADSTAATTITITDTTAKPSSGHALLHPPSLVAGVGASSDAPAEEVPTLLAAALAAAGLARDSVAEIATIDRRAGDPALTGLGLPVRAFATEELAAVTVPTPSAAVESAVGTPSVCEAAALLGAGEGAELVVTKQVSPHATVAIARRRHPRGRLSLVGLGPGDRSHRTTAAKLAIAEADVIVGYSGYLDLCSDLITPAQEVVASPIGDEVVRAKRAVAEAAAGRRVALVCSGDSGVYGMASIALEVADEQHLEADIEVVPGVTAALAAAAAAGAPLGHDHAVVSLSDLLTPWPVIAARLEAVAAADFVVALYNPRSNARKWQLEAARSILLEHRAPSVPVAIVTAATRPGESVHITTLGQLDPGLAGMTTCVIVGASTTRMMGRSLVTPRGYHA